MTQIIDFNNNRIINNYSPVSTGLELFEQTNVSISSSDYLFIDRIIVTNTGSAYTTGATLTLAMSTGSIISSGSGFPIIENGKVIGVRITSTGNFSLDSRIDGSIVDISGSNAELYVSLSRIKQINSFLSNPAIYDDFEAVKQKVRLVLYTRKGEIPRLPNLGTRLYAKLFNFDQVQSLEDFVNQVRIILAQDIEEQVSEVEILDVSIDQNETDLDKNKIGLSLTLRHKLQRKISKIDISLNNDNLQILKEYYTNENQEQRAVRYFL